MANNEYREPHEQAREVGLVNRQQARLQRVPDHLRGDGPCSNCGTLDNIVWFTESVFWNAVVRTEPRLTDNAEILCIPCFVKMADYRGYRCQWRLLPEWHWETKAEAAARRASGEASDD